VPIFAVLACSYRPSVSTAGTHPSFHHRAGGDNWQRACRQLMANQVTIAGRARADPVRLSDSTSRLAAQNVVCRPPFAPASIGNDRSVHSAGCGDSCRRPGPSAAGIRLSGPENRTRPCAGFVCGIRRCHGSVASFTAMCCTQAGRLRVFTAAPASRGATALWMTFPARLEHVGATMFVAFQHRIATVVLG